MIALLIGGTVVLCIGLLTVVFGIPIKEFSFGSTMILAGAVVSCAGLLLIGLYAVGREIRNLARQLEAGVLAAVPAALPREPVAEPETLPAPAPGRSARSQPELPPAPRPLPPRPVREDTLFTRDQPSDPPEVQDDTQERSQETSGWEDHPVTRRRASAPSADPLEPPPPEPAPRQRRNIMFSSHRRDKGRDLLSRDETAEQESEHRPSMEEPKQSDAEARAPDSFDRMWPQSSRARPEARPEAAEAADVRTTAAPEEAPEPVRERFPFPRRADTSSVTIVKSGVVDSMAYSLYSDGSIEAQMPEGMVRFASIDELRAHLDQRT